jgi:hypothetical protein
MPSIEPPFESTPAPASEASVLDFRDENGRTRLHRRAMRGQVEPHKWQEWLDAGGDIDVLDQAQNTALHYAVFNNRVENALALLRVGANPNVANYKGHTAAHHAIGLGRRALLDALNEAGADWSRPDRQGWTPLDALAQQITGGRTDLQALHATAEWIVHTLSLAHIPHPEAMFHRWSLALAARGDTPTYGAELGARWTARCLEDSLAHTLGEGRERPRRSRL